MLPLEMFDVFLAAHSFQDQSLVLNFCQGNSLAYQVCQVPNSTARLVSAADALFKVFNHLVEETGMDDSYSFFRVRRDRQMFG
jgi:hypothetical protein